MKAKDVKRGDLVKATIIKTGLNVQLYRRNDGGFVNYSDCKTVYQESELKFLSPAV